MGFLKTEDVCAVCVTPTTTSSTTTYPVLIAITNLESRCTAVVFRSHSAPGVPSVGSTMPGRSPRHGDREPRLLITTTPTILRDRHARRL